FVRLREGHERLLSARHSMRLWWFFSGQSRRQRERWALARDESTNSRWHVSSHHVPPVPADDDRRKGVLLQRLHPWLHCQGQAAAGPTRLARGLARTRS